MYRKYVAPLTADLLLTEAKQENLYEKLVGQINKDFVLANEPLDVLHTVPPLELKMQIHKKIYNLIQYKFAEYLNLLYIVDVAEEQVKCLDGSNLFELSEQVSFLVLKREWQKVWFRNKF